MMKLALVFILIFLSLVINAGQELLVENIAYYGERSVERESQHKNRMLLDLYCPEGNTLFPTIIWFHAGGLRVGKKHIPEALKNNNVCVVSANYRLFPAVKSPAYVEDSAAAVAWVYKNISNYGGDSSLIFVSGHSAGGYLASMVGLDKKWLAAHNIEANKLAGIISFSGHTITHFTVREEKGIKRTQPIIDEMAPLYHVRPDAPPLLLITGDREKEMLGRYEENAYMMRMMRVAGHKQTRLIELQGYGHDMAEPAYPLMLEEVRRLVTLKDMAQQ